jgi:NAD(P)-dependent dehydrogenase (short-subunit alcohol dehydrogenase family)
MNLQLDGKRAAISGSTAGIGHAIAEALARERTRVVINGRSERSLDEARARLGGATAMEVDGFAGDLGTAAAAESLARTSLIKRFATPEEVGPFVAFVASPLAAAVNGATLRVDGGVVKRAF